MKKLIKKIVAVATNRNPSTVIISMVDEVYQGRRSLLTLLREEGMRQPSGDYHLPEGTVVYTDGLYFTLTKPKRRQEEDSSPLPVGPVVRGVLS